jgi:hypothetical protein
MSHTGESTGSKLGSNGLTFPRVTMACTAEGWSFGKNPIGRSHIYLRGAGFAVPSRRSANGRYPPN